MKITILLFGILISLNLFANEKLGQINDPDGYTNVREKPTTNSRILFKILADEYFYYEDSGSNDWCKVTNMDGKSGFMHKSRISSVNEFKIKEKVYNSNEFKLKIREKNIGKTTIKLLQIQNPKYYCDAYVEITNLKTKELKYKQIDALGSSAGVAFLENVIPNHILIVKHGDYDGRTIIVSESGKITEIPGGSVSKLINNKYLINLAECDLGYCGLSIYDIDKEKIVFNYDSEFEIYEIKNKIVLDLDFENGKDYSVINFEKLQLDKIDIKTNIENYYFKDLIDYDIEKGCLCY
ncbi:SH3 domain-containing protein [Flavivirga jejuensis]|uniref:SH3 domain-containing protein n=1 Tax=Flavivirga jejuensis TaxID=870487 RepID=A0ABT8WLJ3_9FLAO|nr:SH3 domain-containing protein [Flavivirga jejuensis]MDO5974029.1 SH3 domain-containing protein [Flavivirga jejuensis]